MRSVVVVVVLVNFDGEWVFAVTLRILVDGRASIALIQSEKYPDIPELYKARPSWVALIVLLTSLRKLHEHILLEAI